VEIALHTGTVIDYFAWIALKRFRELLKGKSKSNSWNLFKGQTWWISFLKQLRACQSVHQASWDGCLCLRSRRQQ